jgi:hypothetical protein
MKRKLIVTIFYLSLITLIALTLSLLSCGSAPVVVNALNAERSAAIDRKLQDAPALIHTLAYDGIDPSAFKDPKKAADRNAAEIKLQNTLDDAKAEISLLRQDNQTCQEGLIKLQKSNLELTSQIGSSSTYRNILFVIMGVAVLLLFLRFGLNAMIEAFKSIMP